MVLGIPWMLKIGTTVTGTVLVDQACEIDLAYPQGGMVITLSLFCLSVAAQSPEAVSFSTSDHSRGPFLKALSEDT